MEILVKNRNFFKNRNFGQKSNFFEKSQCFQKSKFFWKIEMFSKIEILVESRNFFQKLQILVKNRNLGRKLNFFPKTPNFNEKSKFWSKFWSKIEILIKNFASMHDWFIPVFRDFSLEILKFARDVKEWLGKLFDPWKWSNSETDYNCLLPNVFVK